jgi:proteasome lid subunit RPN8/RPN11
MKTKHSHKSFIDRLFGFEKYEFESIVVEKEVIDNIIELAKQTHPKEFVAFLEGKIKDKALTIYGLAYQEYEASTNATWSKINFPVMANIVGSVHSHPGPSNRPSNADLNFFSKRGIVHMIIKMPYRQEDIQGYDLKGDKIVFDVSNN